MKLLDWHAFRTFPSLALALLILACGPAGPPDQSTPSEEKAREHAGPPFNLMRREGFGPLRIGLLDREVSALLGPPAERGEPERWAADGLYHVEWRYPKRGITLDLISATERGIFEVAGITIAAPSMLRSWRGVAVNDPLRSVQKNYEGLIDEDAPVGPNQIVAGSVYGGLVFTMTDGRVSRMFLGAAAE